MQTEFIGNLAQHQWAHGQFAVGEKVFLPLDHRRADTQNRVKALLDIFDEPARLLQALLQACVVGAGTVVAQHVGVNVMHPQTRHHIRVELHPEARRHAGLGHRKNQYIGNHDIALHIGEAPPRLGLQAADQANGFAHQRVAADPQVHQAFDIAPRQHVHGLAADAQSDFQHLELRVLFFGRFGGFGVADQCLDLQAQTLAQVTRAHTDRLQALQQVQGHGEVVDQVLYFGLVAIAGQAARQIVERVFQITVFVQRFDQKPQRGPVGIRQAHAQRLAVQKRGERLLAARQFGRVFLLIVTQVVGAGLGVAAPFAVVGGHFVGAVAVPADLIVRAQRRGGVIGHIGCAAGLLCRSRGRHFRNAVTQAHLRVHLL